MIFGRRSSVDQPTPPLPWSHLDLVMPISFPPLMPVARRGITTKRGPYSLRKNCVSNVLATSFIVLIHSNPRSWLVQVVSVLLPHPYFSLSQLKYHAKLKLASLKPVLA